MALGFKPEMIIYDSPVKTKSNLELSIKTGIYINLDNVNEIEKVHELLKTTCKGLNMKNNL